MIWLGPTEPLTVSERWALQEAAHAKRMRKARIGLSIALVSMLVFLAAMTYYVVTVETSMRGCAP